jgi:hypothetical protein
MRLRLIGVLACLFMLAPVAGFARTSSSIVQEAPAASSSKTAKKHAKTKKAAHKKHAKKHGAKTGKKKGQQGAKPGSGR